MIAVAKYGYNGIESCPNRIKAAVQHYSMLCAKQGYNKPAVKTAVVKYEMGISNYNVVRIRQ